jgi:hypothetical protein
MVKVKHIPAFISVQACPVDVIVLSIAHHVEVHVLHIGMRVK